MEKRIFKEVSLAKIQTNPNNPRKNYSGPKFDELVASIRKVGVIEPILIRPFGKLDYFEIVAGERRFRAKSLVASENGGPEKSTIPAIIQEMTDDEAFDLMTIENLQREDLTELEEAQSFKIYLDKKGRGFLPELAERTGINPNYIRRRLTVLSLPDKVLKAWETGKIKYGHCEQLTRVKDKKLIIDYLERLQGDGHGSIETVRNLKRHIDEHAMPLKTAKFKLDEAGCLACQSNTEVQSALFEEKCDATYCTNSACFKKHQGDWLTANWKKYAKQQGTNGFRFESDLKWDQYECFDYRGKPREKCKECSHFISLIFIDGKSSGKQACVGDKTCFNRVIAEGRAAVSKANRTEGQKKKKKTDPEAPRVDWHGEFFREEFYKTRIPAVLSALPTDDLRCLQLSLAVLLYCNSSSRVEFAWQQIPKYSKKKRDSLYSYDIDFADIWERVKAMTTKEIDQAHRDMALEVFMHHGTVPPAGRHQAALLLNIDLQKEWRINKEYLEKKTTKEILAMIAKFGIDKDEKALAFLQENLNKKRGRFDTCKKAELVSIMLESGIDLAGKVPTEILKVEKRSHNINGNPA